MSYFPAMATPDPPLEGEPEGRHRNRHRPPPSILAQNRELLARRQTVDGSQTVVPQQNMEEAAHVRSHGCTSPHSDHRASFVSTLSTVDIAVGTMERYDPIRNIQHQWDSISMGRRKRSLRQRLSIAESGRKLRRRVGSIFKRQDSAQESPSQDDYTRLLDDTPAVDDEDEDAGSPGEKDDEDTAASGEKDDSWAGRSTPEDFPAEPFGNARDSLELRRVNANVEVPRKPNIWSRLRRHTSDSSNRPEDVFGYFKMTTGETYPGWSRLPPARRGRNFSARCIAASNPSRMVGPREVSPGNASPGNASPGNASPGNASPGNVSPRDANPDTISSLELNVDEASIRGIVPEEIGSDELDDGNLRPLPDHDNPVTRFQHADLWSYRLGEHQAERGIDTSGCEQRFATAIGNCTTPAAQETASMDHRLTVQGNVVEAAMRHTLILLDHQQRVEQEDDAVSWATTADDASVGVPFFDAEEETDEQWFERVWNEALVPDSF